VDRVFISSIQRDFEKVREAAKAAIESMDLVPIMAETTGASFEAPRRALLDKVAEADALLLLLGPRYGEPGQSGQSPTEDEFNEAVRLGRPTMVLVQEGEREPEQDEFLARVRGGWEQGQLTGWFKDESDVGLAVVRALRGLERGGGGAELASTAGERARTLAEGEERFGSSSGAKARIVAAPLLSGPLLDAVALDHHELPYRIALKARENRLITNEMGADTDVRGDGIHFTAQAPSLYGQLDFFVGVDGAVVAEGRVGGQSQFFGETQVASVPLAETIAGAGRFALDCWGLIDERGDVRQAALAIAIPEAQSRVFTTEEPGNSMPGGASSLPQVLVVPDPPVVVRREDVASETTVNRLVAEVKRAFSDAGAIYPK
jgi:hypothetical protein